MKKIISISLLLLLFFSCSKNENEMTLFLKTNYSFNERVLNHFRQIYYVKSSELRQVVIQELNEVDVEYKELILEIDNTILSDNSDFKSLLSKCDRILLKLEAIVKYRDDFSIEKLPNVESNDKFFQLNLIKNKLVIAMSYAFEYASQTWTNCGFRKLDSINTNIINNKNNSVQINLSSDILKKTPSKRVVMIDQIMYQGKGKKLNYTLINDYTFANILLDSLAEGKYKLKGKVKIYDRNGEFDIPFEEKFKVK